MTTDEEVAIVKHDQRVKRWVLVLAVIAALLAISTVLALAWGWNQSQRAVEAGQDLAVVVDQACEDEDVRESLGEACPRAAQVKKNDPDPIPLPGIEGPEGPPGPPGPPGASVTGPRGPSGQSIVGPRGPTGQNGDTVVGPPGPVGEDGTDGSNGTNGTNGTNGLNGRGIRSMSLNNAGELVVEFTDGTTQNFGPVIGPRGPEGPAGPQGEAGAPGADGVPGPQGPAGPTCPEGYNGQEIEVQTSMVTTTVIFACVKASE